ncbi:conserved hypothetical protein [Uncinocarpus reesii 1704]|uniref:Pre-rRNA processing protein n=1 Tax=Uncinocarpus reesii (strain UAMH 1704) TaxID=336963 RepID=C4JHE1_UNCRE|nr:uncharacterized protein UREG_01304 [Uncinocarpus reesii 1704]EEP76455.1 conserved hypothetical protein [Uncinocarpus reesii 1704]
MDGTSQSQPQPPEQTPTSLSPSAQLDLAITLALHNWPVLSLAVQSSWGGPTSADKRDWLCAAIAELFTDRPDTDAGDLEEVLLQVMNDEFDVVVDDESAGDVADRIIDLKGKIDKGDLEMVNKLWEDWKQREGKASSVGLFKRVETNDEDQETDEDEEEDGEDEDVEMEDAPATRPPREVIEPEVDEDGFTKVVGRRKR